MTVGAKAPEFVGGRLVTDDGYQCHSYEAALGIFRSPDHHPVRPQTQQLVDEWPEESLALIGSRFLGSGHDPRKEQIGGAVPITRSEPCQ